MSVDRARLRDGMSITLGTGVGVASFKSALACDQGQQVLAAPLQDNAAHALVVGAKPRRVCREFCKAVEFKSREEIERS